MDEIDSHLVKNSAKYLLAEVIDFDTLIFNQMANIRLS